MNKHRFKFYILLAGILITLASMTICLKQEEQKRQFALDRHLVAAVVQGDDKQALALVYAGANPNTRYKPPPLFSLFQLVAHKLNRTPEPINDSPTAFMIACGTPWTDEPAILQLQAHRPDDIRLAKEMLTHGAVISIMDEDEFNLLTWAGYFHRLKTLVLIFDHGANANIVNKNGWTPLYALTMTKPSSAIVRVFLEHGAQANMREAETGFTALYSAVNFAADKDVIRQLLQYGADPNVGDMFGVTPLILARRQKRSDVATLLKQAGTTK